jgi:hypothetical protein
VLAARAEQEIPPGSTEPLEREQLAMADEA